ncbi:hypothetical protein E3N88_17843 [Mikania micrantha]|uniref:Retrovirus-related Pol polyprotein from transposon TNT 1-94-like beta-barrel domain-containing protein n=1 Tax=Mikania micrantha TaxID=192012 RepID=A0A5N6NW19_9ASTR|nr:hypothetical protein E3N88_17843 [Mikania micrantha]
MHFLLTTLKVVYVLSTPIPEILEDGNLEQIRKRSKWLNDNYICLGHILNGMCDGLFDIYQNVETAKVLWDTLEAKYMAEDSSSKKFLVSNFINYKMIDSRSVMEQYNELLRILGQFIQHDMKMDESNQVSSIIDKLPPFWKDYKHNLKHQKGELTLVELGSHFRIEEFLRGFEKTWNNHKLRGKREFQGKDNKGSNKKQIITCWKRGKVGHFKKDCRVGATSHVCKDLRWFKDFQPIEDGSVIKMGNVATEPIKGLGKVKLAFTSGKCLCLDNVLYVPGIRKNLLSGFWGEAMLTACYLLNRVPNKRNKITPYELWYGKPPNLNYLRIWGCRAVVRLNEPKRKNLGERGIPSTSTEPRRTKRARIAKDFVSDFQLYLVEGSRDEIQAKYKYCFNIEEDPKTYNEAMVSRDVAFWKEAINDEMDSIMQNNL